MKKESSFPVKKGGMIALACAAAFAAPQTAMAQAETLKMTGHPLTLQGNISIGYGRIKGDGSNAVTGGPTSDFDWRGDVWTGESNVRFSASSKLGGDFIQGVGFQVESGYQTDTGSSSSTTGTLASRNTGIGVKTSIGNIWGGKWDTPYKEVMGEYYLTSSPMGVQTSTSGFYGSHGLGGGTGGTANGGGGLSNRMNFRRRQSNVINYHSPMMSGFQVLFQYSADEETGNSAPESSMSKRDPYMWSTALAYYGDKITASVAYERHNDFQSLATIGAGAFGSTAAGVASTAAGSGNKSKDTAWSVGVSYEFTDATQVTAYYEKLKWEQSTSNPAAVLALTNLENKKWGIGLRHSFGGPHQIRAGLGAADDYSCNNPNVCTSDTGMKWFNFVYRYRLDKVSWINVSYNQYDNDSNGNWVPSGGVDGAPGMKHQGYSVGVQTSF